MNQQLLTQILSMSGDRQGVRDALSGLEKNPLEALKKIRDALDLLIQVYEKNPDAVVRLKEAARKLAEGGPIGQASEVPKSQEGAKGPARPRDTWP